MELMTPKVSFLVQKVKWFKIYIFASCEGTGKGIAYVTDTL